MLVGLATGVGAYGFHELLHISENARRSLIALGGGFGGGWIAAVTTVALPAIGGLTAGWIAHRWCAESRGGGVEEVVEAIRARGGHISARVAWHKSIASAATIGFGGSAGTEGPVVQIGAALGSWLGRFLEAGARDIPVFVAAGAVGGLSATFGVPLAGVFFTMEVVLKDFANEAFPAVVVSSAVAAAVARALSNGGLVVTVDYQLKSAADLLLLGALGAACVPLGLFYIRARKASEAFFNGMNAPIWVKPGIGGALVGVLSLIEPRVAGTGGGLITDTISGRFSGWQAALFAPLKAVATALTLGSGGSGGALMPALAIGASAGAAGGGLASALGMSGAAPGPWAVVGMAAVFTASFQAPATGILLGLELTRDYGLLPPLMIACVVSNLASRRSTAQAAQAATKA